MLSEEATSKKTRTPADAARSPPTEAKAFASVSAFFVVTFLRDEPARALEEFAEDGYTPMTVRLVSASR